MDFVLQGLEFLERTLDACNEVPAGFGRKGAGFRTFEQARARRFFEPRYTLGYGRL
jgi:hypothetical protein